MTLISSTTLNGVPYTVHQCTTKPGVSAPATVEESSLVKRNTNLCGAPCNTYCNPGGGGPDPNGTLRLCSV